MEDYNKIVESLNVHFKKARNIEVIKPLTIENYYDVENTLIRLNSGEIKYGKEREKIEEGDLLFVPAGKYVSISYGTGMGESLSNDDFISKKEFYFKNISFNSLKNKDIDSFSYINLDAKVFDSVNFFSSLDIPPFVIPNNEKINTIIDIVLKENSSDEAGYERVIKLECDRLVVEIIRYILHNNLFIEQLATNSTYFKDPRLLDIFAYIKENLDGDLSNKALANVANVSEDYVGQYFKMLTGINPQDYIEYQRMENAVNLLRTSKKSIREIGREVGYKDTAYFCRRFKMMFGIPAGKMRRRESLMNI